MRREDLVKARPFVKWAGGKRKLAETYENIGAFPEEFDRYFEPFLGGGAVFFRLQPQEALLSDDNEELITTYRVIKDSPEDLFKHLSNHENRHLSGRKEYYYEVRGLNPNDLTDCERAARMIFLNRTCYNGLYRVNQKGEFNVPYGRYKNPTILDKRNLANVSTLLDNVQLENLDFEEAVKDAREGDFVYMDPPYRPLTDTSSFTSYTEDNFDDEEQKRLKRVFIDLAQRGCHVLESNSNTPEIRKLYDENDIFVYEVMAPRAISCKADGRKQIKELVISNYELDNIESSQTPLPS